MKLKTNSDMGSVKIFNKGMSCFFANGYGDGTNIVEILTRYKESDARQFLGHFTVKEGEAYLSMYDCADKSIYTFKKGRYFVYLKAPRHLIIAKWDNELHG